MHRCSPEPGVLPLAYKPAKQAEQCSNHGSRSATTVTPNHPSPSSPRKSQRAAREVMVRWSPTMDASERRSVTLKQRSSAICRNGDSMYDRPSALGVRGSAWATAQDEDASGAAKWSPVTPCYILRVALHRSDARTTRSSTTC
ncbi:hypothetical protein K466DRAFT_6550 [Polyporus arcularius HHB13444]|uniref:Uncharacterized protein n=1 Tax=Polyporus arcularius HHB13444 TaxID=1314778 RepID=A0A5C3Q1W8_9APHY|nr:hypothetical protein K466DRAFT_6550 [Polyporus arcularius HHB13444]